jgi:hypothetical protein
MLNGASVRDDYAKWCPCKGRFGVESGVTRANDKLGKLLKKVALVLAGASNFSILKIVKAVSGAQPATHSVVLGIMSRMKEARGEVNR